ncbi:MAG TPA: hypothetical protein PK264_21985, partial [Hyphomicrobiaceae bacterium]|nr:hypothetical protein [Hyphomicrobiaceae bacterium]
MHDTIDGHLGGEQVAEGVPRAALVANTEEQLDGIAAAGAAPEIDVIGMDADDAIDRIDWYRLGKQGVE